MDPFLKSRSMLCLLGILPLAAVGCQSVSPGGSLWKTQQTRPQQSQPDQQASVKPPMNVTTPGVGGKSDFHEKATQSQEFNVHIDLGKNKANSGDFEGAAAEFQKALDASGHYSGLLSNNGQSAQKAQAHRKLAGALDHLGRFDQAEEHYRAASKAAPRDPRVWNDIGYSYYMQGRLEAAAQCLRYAEKLAPTEPQIQTNLGMVLAATNQAGEALDHLSKSGGPAAGHHNLAFCMASMGKEGEARDHYRKALELQPQLPKAREALAKLESLQVPAQSSPDIARSLPLQPQPELAGNVTPQPQLQPQPELAKTVAPNHDLTRLDAPPPLSPITPVSMSSTAAPMFQENSVQQVAAPPSDTAAQGIPWEK